MSNEFNTKRLARAGIIAALYAILSLVTFPVVSGAIQFRISEAFSLLPFIFPEAVPALAIGCFISNLLTGCAPWDVALGSVITLAAAAFTLLAGKLFRNTALKIAIGGLFPVLFNAFFLPLIWLLCYGGLEYAYILQAVFLIVSQSVSVYAIGSPLYFAVKKMKEKGYGFLE